MLSLKHTSIKAHLTLVIMAISTVSVLLTTLAISIIGVHNLKQNILDELSSSATIVGDRNKAVLEFDVPSEAKNNLQNVFSVRPEILKACLYKVYLGQENPTLFADYSAGTGEFSCAEDVRPRALIQINHAEVLRPIVSGSDVVGYVMLISSLDEVSQFVKKQTIIALSVTLAVLFVSYFMALRLRGLISSPILSLTETARAVAFDKDYTIRAQSTEIADPKNRNELATLTHAFNTMLVEIDARETRLKQQYAEIEKAKNAAEAASRAKSQFLANVSHELRTPLNAIIGFSSILMNQLFGPLGDVKYNEYAKDINDSGTHLLEIINDILDLSKAEAGKLSLDYEEIHVPKAIMKCVNIVNDRAYQGGVKLTYDAPRTLPPLFADRLRFIQILLNVLSNAIKFTPPGGTVHVSVVTELEGHDVASFVVIVSDTGIGMTEADVQQAFQSFGQVDSGLNRKYEGTGLGLPLTKKLIELHHGSITIKSEPGKGTEVHLSFPAVPPDGLVLGVSDRV